MVLKSRLQRRVSRNDHIVYQEFAGKSAPEEKSGGRKTRRSRLDRESDSLCNTVEFFSITVFVWCTFISKVVCP